MVILSPTSGATIGRLQLGGNRKGWKGKGKGQESDSSASIQQPGPRIVSLVVHSCCRLGGPFHPWMATIPGPSAAGPARGAGNPMDMLAMLMQGQLPGPVTSAQQVPPFLTQVAGTGLPHSTHRSGCQYTPSIRLVTDYSAAPLPTNAQQLMTALHGALSAQSQGHEPQPASPGLRGTYLMRPRRSVVAAGGMTNEGWQGHHHQGLQAQQQYLGPAIGHSGSGNHQSALQPHDGGGVQPQGFPGGWPVVMNGPASTASGALSTATPGAPRLRFVGIGMGAGQQVAMTQPGPMTTQQQGTPGPQTVQPPDADTDMTSAGAGGSSEVILTREQWQQQLEAEAAPQAGQENALDERRRNAVLEGKNGRVRLWIPEEGAKQSGEVQVQGRMSQYARCQLDWAAVHAQEFGDQDIADAAQPLGVRTLCRVPMIAFSSCEVSALASGEGVALIVRGRSQN